jgi:hypothetical protein
LQALNGQLLRLLPHISNKVETIYEPTAAGLNFKTTDTTNGLGDLRIDGLNTCVCESSPFNNGRCRRMTLPTGSIDKYFTSSPTQRAAYNMQMGSGTPDPSCWCHSDEYTRLFSFITSWTSHCSWWT